ADASRVFMILPDGRAEPVAISAWNHRFAGPPPGAALVVPADPRPYSGRELFQSVADVLSKIALTAASISVISR
ncbi:MAG TPA: capsule biosynthesis GfcC family protein, partial [Azospirillaceae bacterium]|nr:capsule biosynthesis GfcC family protein [Azospirillaceae bacterium]